MFELLCSLYAAWENLKIYDFYMKVFDLLKVCGMEEALEMPIINDLTMVLGSISQVINLYRVKRGILQIQI